MLRKIFLYAVCVSLILSVAGLGAAEERKSEWTEKTYNFSTLKTVLVTFSVDPNISLGEVDRLKMLDYAQQFGQGRHVKATFLNEEQLENLISKATGVNLREQKTLNPDSYKQTMAEYTSSAVNAVFNISVKDFGYTSVWVPDKLESYTDYEYQTVYTPRYDYYGRVYYVPETKSVPVTRQRIVPAHYEYIANAGCDFSLVDMKTSQKVWLISDFRDAAGKEPIKMIERIFKRTAGKLHDTLQKAGR